MSRSRSARPECAVAREVHDLGAARRQHRGIEPVDPALEGDDAKDRLGQRGNQGVVVGFRHRGAPVPAGDGARSGDDGTVPAGESSGELSGVFSGVPFDIHRFRAVFPDRWAAFLRANFRSSAHVAVFFDVDDRTARNWLEGITGPRGAHVAVALIARPEAAREHLLREAA